MKKRLLCLLLVLCFALSACSGIGSGDVENLRVHYIDVGKGDCILIQTPNDKTMLIDSGDKNSGGTVTSYLNNLGIKKINMLVVSHAHVDHMGGMPEVVKNFEIDGFYMTGADASKQSDCLPQLNEAVDTKKIKRYTISPESKLKLDNTIKVDVFGPNNLNYENFNDTSAVIKITYKDTSFLFTGDAGKAAEKDMLDKGYDLNADVLKVGHHGNMDATTPDFLSKVSPAYAVIQTGTSYSYKDRLQKIKEAKINNYVNVNNGNITAESDGKNIKVNSQK